MRYVPPCTSLIKWVNAQIGVGTSRLMPLYDDVLNVLSEFLRAIPVDEAWYKDKYPALQGYLASSATETATSHFCKHGYFEGREPFAPGWRNLTAPVRFRELKTRLSVIPTRGRLRVDVQQNDFLDLIRRLLKAVPVDERWYRTAYPDVAEAIANATVASAADHYIKLGYVDGRLPFEIAVDEKWYVSRYVHVRAELNRGAATSAQDHFMRMGYREGCRPTPP
jgi:hypothetical protein